MSLRQRLAFAAVLNSMIFLTEAISGFAVNSLSLIMDSAHNLSDEMALIFLFLACVLPLKLSKNLQRGANALNSFGLILVCLVLIWQAIERVMHPQPVIGLVPIAVGLVAAVGNAGVAYILWRERERSAAIRLAYLHNLGDIYVSLAPVVAGILVSLTSNSVFDPLVALIVALWIIWGTSKEVLVSKEQLLWPEELVVVKIEHDEPLTIENLQNENTRP